MEENKFLIKSYKQMFLVIGIFTLVLFVGGITFAFFNYTRTGVANNIKTGRIYFNSTQNGTLNMTNIFPMTSTQASTGTLDTVTVGIQGDTTYANGEEFEITLTGINNTINGKQIPINYIAEYTAVTGKNIGTESETYWESRNSKNANIYTLTETGKVEEGKQVLVGYIKNGETGIEGTLTIKAYIDADRIAISDTYDLANPETDNNGTTTNWVDGRVVFTTEEWHSFQNSSTPISFKIKAESNEGIWVKKPSKSIASCPDCKFMYYVADPDDESTCKWTTWNMGGYDETNDESYALTPTQITSGLYDNYEELMATTGKNYFLGVKLNNNNEVTNAYACGVKDNEPFCIEGTADGSKYVDNQTLLQGANLWNNTCTVGSNYTQCGNYSGSLSADAHSLGTVNAGVGDGDACEVGPDGAFACRGSAAAEPDPSGPVWVEEPAQGTIESCPNCKFIYTTDAMYTTWNMKGYDETNDESYALTPTKITSGYSENYNDIVTSSGKNYFLGVVTNNNNEVTNAYACGVKDGTPFCIEGTSDGSKYSANSTLLQGANLWNNTCTVSYYTKCGLWDHSGSVSAYTYSTGMVNTGVSDGDNCIVSPGGNFVCVESSGGGSGGK